MFQGLLENPFVEQSESRGEDVELKLENVAEENAALKKRYISSLKEYKCAVERNRGDTGYEESIFDIDSALSKILSFLTINELLTVRCVSRKLRIWCEFELKCRKHIFVITDEHKSDYNLFQNFILFPNVRTLVIQKLQVTIDFTVFLRLCKDFLTQLQYIVVNNYENYNFLDYMQWDINPEIDVRASSNPFAQKLLVNLRKSINLSIGDNVTIYILNGLPTITEDEIEGMERLRGRNNFLRDKSELLEKECQRIKNYHNLSLFSILPKEVTLKILDMLSVSELFSLRLVSKEMKQWADIKIRSHKQVMEINFGCQSTYRIHLWSILYSNIKILKISETGIDLEVLLRICENRFPYLTGLIVCSCENHNIELFGDYFPMIENLALRYNDTVGEEIAGLLSKLPHLSRLVVDGSINTEIAPFFSFGRHANSLRSFMYSCSIIQEIDCKDISNTLVAEIPNLTSLRLNLAMTTLLNFSDFQLMTIKELDICCRRLDGCLTLSQNVLSVTKLKLSTQTGSAEEIATVLNNFTNLNSLELDFFRNHDILFNATLMEALVGLNSLKYFSFFDAYYSKEKYTINEGEKSALVKVLVALKNVEKIKIEFCQQSYYDDDLVTAVNNLTVKRPQQNIQLIIPDDDFDNDLNDLYDTNYRENYSDGYSD